jgi:hypothetical protein
MERDFPEDDETVRATLIRALELKGLEDDARLVRLGSLSLEQTDYDNWNGGTYFFTIRLRLPLEVFVQVEPQIKETEERVLTVAQNLWREHENDSLSAVSIYPGKIGKGGVDVELLETSRLPDFWPPRRFRLFLSHCSSQKVAVGELRDALEALGITGFVAHADIEPSREWEREIESALRSAEALLAIISDDFCSSRWCDQEVGYALGRGLPVIPVRFNAPPHGFIAKIQALPVPAGHLPNVAPTVAQLLLQTPRTSASMSNAVVTAVIEAWSFATAKEAVSVLETVTKVSVDQAKELRAAIETNSQLRHAFGVPDRIERYLLQQGHRTRVR